MPKYLKGWMMTMNKEVIFVAVDSGKSHTKVAWYEWNNPKQLMLTDIFRTVATPITKSDFFNADMIVKYEDCYYDVGHHEIRLTSDNSKLTMAHELCVYTGATALLDLNVNLKETQFVKLAVNVPLHDFKIDKRKYIDLYKNKAVKMTRLICFMKVVVRLLKIRQRGREITM